MDNSIANLEIDYNRWRIESGLKPALAKVQKHINISPTTWAAILEIATTYECVAAGKPSVVQLLDRIALGDLVIIKKEAVQ